MAVKQQGQSGAARAVTEMIRHALSRKGQQELYQLNGNYVSYDFYQDEFTLRSQFGRTIYFGWVPSQDDPELFCELIDGLVERNSPQLYELQMGVDDPTEPLGFHGDNYTVSLLQGGYHPEVVTYRQWKGLAFDCLIDRDTQDGVEESLGDFLPPGWDYLLAEVMRYGRQIIGRRNMLLTNDHRRQLMRVMEKIARYNNGDADQLNLDHFKVVPTQPHDPKWLARSLQVAQLDWTLKTQA